MKLGVLRLLAEKIPALMKLICGNRRARFGTAAETIPAMNERILYLGRMCLVSLAPRGFVDYREVCRG